MEPRQVLLDTSIFIEHFRKQNKSRSILFSLYPDYKLFTSTIVEFELLAGATDSSKRVSIEELLSLCTILPVSSKIARKTADIFQELRKRNQLIDMGDILIAATAIEHDLPVKTLNLKHFNRIPQLKIAP